MGARPLAGWSRPRPELFEILGEYLLFHDADPRWTQPRQFAGNSTQLGTASAILRSSRVDAQPVCARPPSPAVWQAMPMHRATAGASRHGAWNPKPDFTSLKFVPSPLRGFPRPSRW